MLARIGCEYTPRLTNNPSLPPPPTTISISTNGYLSAVQTLLHQNSLRSEVVGSNEDVDCRLRLLVVVCDDDAFAACKPTRLHGPATPVRPGVESGNNL